jgi:hypothetical protein
MSLRVSAIALEVALSRLSIPGIGAAYTERRGANVNANVHVNVHALEELREQQRSSR